MKLNKRYRLHKATATESGRYATDSVHVEEWRAGDPAVECKEDETPGLAVATEGHILAVVPVALAEGDEPGYLSRETLIAACKGSARVEAEIRANSNVQVRNGKYLQTFERPDPSLEFPNWRQVFPGEGDLAPWRVMLNPRYLLSLAEAIGCETDGAITLTLQKGAGGKVDPGRAIHVEHAGGGLGVIMPVTRDKSDGPAPVVLTFPAGPAGAKSRDLADYSADELATELDRRFAEIPKADIPEGAPAPEPKSKAPNKGRRSRKDEPAPAPVDEPVKAPVEPRRESVTAEVGPGTKPGFIEIRFSRKPRVEIRAAVREAGFRWSRGNGCWYGPEDRVPACVLELVGVKA